MSGIEPFYAIDISRQATALEAKGRHIIHMEYGQPSTGAPKAAIARAHHILDTDPMGYFDSDALKLGLVAHYQKTYGVSLDKDQFFITCGASPALVLSLVSSFKPGDVIATARPGYVAYRNNLKALSLVPLEIPCDESVRYQLTPEALDRLDPPPQGVIIASPANPTGTLIPPSDLKAIAEICARKSITLISDEIYHGLTYQAPAHSVVEFAPDALVVNSFSKYFSMVGWRLGWLLVPPQAIEKTRAYIGNLFLTAPSLSQHAGLLALEAHEELQGHLSTYAHNRDLLLKALPSLGLKSIAPPDGAFYIYAHIGHLSDNSLEFCQRLLEESGVALAPGIDFDPDQGRYFIRFSFAVATDLIEEALLRLVPWFQDQVQAQALAQIQA